MAWVVDTSVVLDVRTNDPVFSPTSTACLHAHRGDGLVLCPVTFVELAPTFAGDCSAQENWLSAIPIGYREAWTDADTATAHHLWHDYIVRKRLGTARKRPVADVLIAAFALRFQGLISRNRADFAAIATALAIVEP